MPWLVRDGEVLATLEVAETGAARRRGLLGRDGFEGALLLEPARSVHSVGMRFALDVAFVDADLRVLDVVTLLPNRITLPRWRAHGVIEAEAGAFRSWELCLGDELEVRGA